MNKNDAKTLDEILAAIDEAIAPGEMSQERALYLLDELAGQVEVRMAALREDMGRSG